MFVGRLYVFFCEVSVPVICPFLNWVVCLFIVELEEFFTYSGPQCLTDMHFTHISSQSVACLFTSFWEYLFIWPRWVFVATRRLSPALVSRGFSSLQCAGFSLLWLPLLRRTGSRHAGISSCSSQAQYLCLPGSSVQAQQLWCTGSVASNHVASSWTRDWIRIPCIDRRILIHFYQGSPPIYFIMKHFDEQNFLILRKSNFLLWLLFSLYFVRKLCLPPSQKDIFLCLLLEGL